MKFVPFYIQFTKVNKKIQTTKQINNFLKYKFNVYFYKYKTLIAEI